MASTLELREATAVERLAYSRRQAAQALGVSISTIDRKVVPTIDTVKTPWGQRLIPVDELERFLHEHLEPGRPVTIRPGVARRFRSLSSSASGTRTRTVEHWVRSRAG